MEADNNAPELRRIAAAQRVRASGPILILAVLFVVGAFLTWYFTWFGRNLSDADISQYLADEKHPRRVQHALLQIQHRIESGDPTAKQWYPQVINLSSHTETEFRLTVAWLMGFDNKSEEFHQALLKLVKDSQPIVRRNAALALVRFNDAAGRQELLAVLHPFEIKSPATGTLESLLPAGSDATRGTLVGRINTGGAIVEVRSPLPGRIEGAGSAIGSTVNAETTLLRVISDEDSVWEVLRGLALVGQPEDLSLIESYAQSTTQPARLRQQAAATAEAIKRRSSQN